MLYLTTLFDHSTNESPLLSCSSICTGVTISVPNSGMVVRVTNTTPEVAANHVAAVLQKGYLINDRVLRPAMVVVSQG